MAVISSPQCVETKKVMPLPRELLEIWKSNQISDTVKSHVVVISNVQIARHMLRIKFMSIYCETAFRWMTQSTFDDKLTLVQVQWDIPKNTNIWYYDIF